VKARKRQSRIAAPGPLKISGNSNRKALFAAGWLEFSWTRQWQFDEESLSVEIRGYRSHSPRHTGFAIGATLALTDIGKPKGRKESKSRNQDRANRLPILRAGIIPSYSFLLLSNVHRHVLPRCVFNQND